MAFGVLGGSAVTNTGATTVSGAVGVSPGSSVTGFPPGTTTAPPLHLNDATAIQAQNDLTTAYNAVASTPCTTTLTGVDPGGLTLNAGVYCFASSAQLTGTLTLDAQGNPNAVFLFKIGSTLTTASASRVLVINGGSTCNVFWQVGSSATFGTTTAFSGNILALTSITMTTGANISGRLLARNGAVTLDTNIIAPCGAGAIPPGADIPALSGKMLLLLAALIAVVAMVALRSHA
ncbi:MAG TPA: ice-binding family protein [Thermoanaerobaculia bacterium]